MRKTIQLNELMLSLDNPRLDSSLSELDEIKKMMENQKGKLIELAIDILEYGLSPLDLVAVYPSDIVLGAYVVAEGNRRICTLKLLENPDLIKEIDKSLWKRFKELSASKDVITEVDAVVFEEEGEALHWIELRHLGEQNGKGLSKWDSVQKMRFQKKYQGENTLFDFWKWLDEKNILSFSEINKVTKTNWQRILRDSGFNFLKMKKSGTSLIVLENDLPVFTERIQKVCERLAKKTVAIVYDQEQIDKFFDEISRELYGHAIAQEELDIHQLSFGTEVGGAQKGTTDFTYESKERAEIVNKEVAASEKFSAIKEQKERVQSQSKDLFSGSVTIIPYKYQINTSNMRVNKIIHELKRLNPDEFPNACGTLLRALFELSAKVYKESLTKFDQSEDQFIQVIKFAANDLRSQGRITNPQHSAIFKDVDTLREIFNGYMHNVESYPSSEALKNIFKAHRKFLEECLRSR